MSISRVGVDIAKTVFSVHCVDRHDQVEWHDKYKSDKWLDAIVKRIPQGGRDRDGGVCLRLPLGA